MKDGTICEEMTTRNCVNVILYEAEKEYHKTNISLKKILFAIWRKVSALYFHHFGEDTKNDF